MAYNVAFQTELLIATLVILPTISADKYDGVEGPSAVSKLLAQIGQIESEAKGTEALPGLRLRNNYLFSPALASTIDKI